LLKRQASCYHFDFEIYREKGQFCMSKVCQITGKKQSRGYTYVTRGIAKKKKGIGIKVTGKTRRAFLPNLQEKRLWVPEEKRFVTLRLSCAAMRTIEKKGLVSVIRQMSKREMSKRA
jgi:large subunit ribosomal protein L28